MPSNLHLPAPNRLSNYTDVAHALVEITGKRQNIARVPMREEFKLQLTTWLDCVWLTMAFLALMLLLQLCVNCSAFRPVKNVIKDDDLARQWLAASYELDQLIYPRNQQIITAIDRITGSDVLPLLSECRDSLTAVKNGLEARQVWALKMVDASAQGSRLFAFGYASSVGKHIYDFDLMKTTVNCRQSA